MGALDELEIGEATGLGVTKNTGAKVVGEKLLPVMEIFGPTIQGEGPAIGEQTFFVRLGGCDYRCKKCDSMAAVLPTLVKENANWITGEAIFNQLLDMRDKTLCNSVVLSGGNPLIHDITGLVTSLKLAGFRIHVETQGTVFRPWVNFCDQIILSPKMPGMGEKYEEDKLFNFIGLTNPSVPIAVKLVVFSMMDIDFAVAAFNGLDRAYGSRCDKYISLGNASPPSEPGGPEHPLLHVDDLIRDYTLLMEDLLQDKRLRDVRILPQLHVIYWGNRKGV